MTGITWQFSDDGDRPDQRRLILSGYQDPGDGLGRRTFTLDMRMDRTYRRPDGIIVWDTWGRA